MGAMNDASGRFRVEQCSDERMFRDVMNLSDCFLSTATHMTEAELMERYRRCPEAFICIVKNHGGEASLRGYFALLPLNEAGTRAIQSGKVSCGREITAEYLASRGVQVTSVYLSVVCALNARARAAAIHGIIAKLRAWFHEYDVRHLFVRAATPPGARMLQRLTGTSFSPDGLIHNVELAGYSRITSRNNADVG
jgi:hypothetical protein